MAVANNFLAAPTVANQPEGVTNFDHNIPGPLTMNQQTYRGDQNLGKLGSVFGRYTHSNYVNTTNYNSASAGSRTRAILRNGKRLGDFAYHQPRLKEREQLPLRLSLRRRTAGLVCSARFGGFRAWPERALYHLRASAVRRGPMWPDDVHTSGGGPVNSYTGSTSPEWEFADSFTSVHGKHTLGFGVDYRHWTLTRNLDDDFYGDWGYSSNLINSNSEPISTRIQFPVVPTRPCRSAGGSRASVRHRQRASPT